MTSENTGWEPFDPSSGGVPESLLSIRPPDGERGAVVVTAFAPGLEDSDWPALVALRVAELNGCDGDAATLIDLGLEAPSLHTAVAEPPGEGISDVFLFSASLQRVSRMVREGAVRLVQAGTVAGDPARLRSHRAWSKLLGREVARGTTVVLHVPLAAGGSEDIMALADTLVLLAAPGDADTGFAKHFPGTVIRLAPPSEPATADPIESVWDEEAGDVVVFTGFGDDEVDVRAEDATRDEDPHQEDDSPRADAPEEEHLAWSTGPEPEVAEADAGIIVIDTLAPELHAAMDAVEKPPVAGAPVEALDADDPGESLDVEFAEQSSAVIDAVFSEPVPEEPEGPAELEEGQDEEGLESSDHWSEPAASWAESPDEHDESAYPWEDRGDRRAEGGEDVEETQDASRDPFRSEAEPGEPDGDLPAVASEADSGLESESSRFDLDGVPNPFARPFSRDDVVDDAAWEESLAEEFEGLPEVKDRKGKSFLRVAATVAVVVIGAGAIGLTTVRPTDDPEFDGGVRPSTPAPAAATGSLAADPQMGDPLSALARADSAVTGDPASSDLVAAAAVLAQSDQGAEETPTVVDGLPGLAAEEATPDEAADPATREPAEAKASVDPPTAEQTTATFDRAAAAEADARPSTTAPSSTTTKPSPDRTASTGTTAPARAEPASAAPRTRPADPTPDPAPEEPDPSDDPAGGVGRATDEAPTEAPSPTVPPADRARADTRPAEETPTKPAAAAPSRPASEPADRPSPTRATDEPRVAEATPPEPEQPTAAEPTPPTPTVTARDDMTPPPPSTRPSGLMAYGLEVGSHSQLASARAQASSLQARFPHLEFIEVPVGADGGLVYRVVAGPAATASEAEGIRTSLTGFLGRAASSSATVRSTGLTFLLGAFEDYPEAKERVATAGQRGVPAYLAEFPVSGGRMVYRVYAGAFASEAEAAALGSVLEDAGFGMTPLIERVGRPTR